MKITSEKVKTLLEIERKNTTDYRWIDHCLCVEDSAGKIAKALNEKRINVDIDKTITLGYLHDIGKYNGESYGHVMRGYEYLKNKGYDDEYCNVCLTHSYLNNDINCLANDRDYTDSLNENYNFIKNYLFPFKSFLNSSRSYFATYLSISILP